MVDPVILSTIAGAAKEIFLKLKEHKIIQNEGLVIDHASCEAEYRIDLFLGDIQSRTTRLSNYFKSHLAKSVKLDAIEASGYGLISNENFVENKWIINNNGKITIDFPKIISNSNSTHVMIYIKVKIPIQLRDRLIYRQIAKSSFVENGKTVTHIDLVLDYANIWHSVFSSFSVRNINFNININVVPGTLQIAIPEDIRKKLQKADRLATTKGNARKYLKHFQEIVLGMQSKEFQNKIMQIIELNPPNCRIKEVSTKIRSLQLANSDFAVVIPDRFEAKLEGRINDHEIATHTKLLIDFDKYNELLKQEFRKLREVTKNIRF